MKLASWKKALGENESSCFFTGKEIENEIRHPKNGENFFPPSQESAASKENGSLPFQNLGVTLVGILLHGASKSLVLNFDDSSLCPIEIICSTKVPLALTPSQVKKWELEDGASIEQSFGREEMRIGEQSDQNLFRIWLQSSLNLVTLARSLKFMKMEKEIFLR